MVNDKGQLYTIEGIAASLMLLVTAYFVLGGTTIYSPGESHVADLQLEQIASDTLIVLDTPWQVDYQSDDKFLNAISPLENFTLIMISGSTPQKAEAKAWIEEKISYLLNRRVNLNNPQQLANDSISYNLNCIDRYGAVTYEIGSPLQPRLNSVRVTRLVNQGDSTYLVEMRIWRN